MRVDLDDFEESYRIVGDPWRFATSRYGLDKYDVTVTSLSAQRYTRCFEPACSIGVLTERLAKKVDSVIACDASISAIDRARERLSGVDNIEFVSAAIPDWWPNGSFDLIVLSELGYYWDLAGWRGIIRRCTRSLRSGGELIAVHWLGSSPDHLLHGTDVHRELCAELGPSDVHREGPGLSDGTGDRFVLDRWTGVNHAQR
jgi:SAM-dependent methyltransferase